MTKHVARNNLKARLHDIIENTDDDKMLEVARELLPQCDQDYVNFRDLVKPRKPPAYITCIHYYYPSLEYFLDQCNKN